MKKTTFIAALVAILPLAGLLTPASAAESATVEVVSLSGAGARATFAYTTGAGRRCVDTVLEVQASNARQLVPSGPPSTIPHLEISLTQSRCGSGRVLFTGQGVLENPDLRVAGSLTEARLQATVTAQNPTDGATRSISLDVFWSPLGEPELVVTNESVGAPGSVINSHHQGAVSRASASASITVVDPASAEAPITVQAQTSDASVWDTADKRITVTQPDTQAEAASPVTVYQAATASATATSSGYWTGYWRWTWNSTTSSWSCSWIWVWVSSSGGYITP